MQRGPVHLATLPDRLARLPDGPRRAGRPGKGVARHAAQLSRRFVMRVVLHGVRGSTPAPGRSFLRVGGNTSCVAITPSGHDRPTLLLDAGTGLSSVTRDLSGSAFVGDLLLTHLHWDHVHGLPFFAAGDRDDARVRLLLPAQGDASPDRVGSAAELLAGSMSPPHFPIRPEGLRGDWSFEAIAPGTFTAGGCQVTAAEIPHKGGRTFGYRVEADGESLAYLPDHHPALTQHPGLELAREVDVLCHGAMFHDSERATAHEYGHATLGETCRLATEARVGRVVLIHHAPTRTDDDVEAMAAELAGTGCPPTVVGHEGDVVLGADTRDGAAGQACD
jgi:phosphoribosyl 1,2-cyclic phosphodiesterase